MQYTFEPYGIGTINLPEGLPSPEVRKSLVRFKPGKGNAKNITQPVDLVAYVLEELVIS
ncbi:MAG: hypothetical protein ACE5KT_00830 [Methanosarcinales archaeon]